MKDRIITAFETFYADLVDRAPQVLVGLIFLVIFVLLGWLIRRVVTRRLSKGKTDRLMVNFTGRTLFIIFVIIGAVIFLNQLGLGQAVKGVLAGAGVSAIILGFAFKDLGENFLAGFFLAFSRPFSPGDVIEVEGFKGTVRMLNLRNTHIRTFDGKDIFIPNAMLIKNPLLNYTRDGLLRYNFVVGIDYQHDMKEAAALITEALNDHPNLVKTGEMEPFIMLESFGASTINLGVYYWVDSKNFLGHIARLRTSVAHAVFQKLADGGIQMPSDIMELKLAQQQTEIPIRLTEVKN